jgi:adenylate cyclase
VSDASGLEVGREIAVNGMSHGDPAAAMFEAALLPGRLERTVTPAAVERLGGLEVAEIAELMEAFGLPRPGPDDPTFTPQEARVFIELARLDELWPAKVRRQVARAYGAMLGDIARVELRAFQIHTEPHVRARGGDPAAQLRAIQSAFGRLLPLADPLLLGVHRRCVEHEIAQGAVRAAELDVGPIGLPGAVEVTFLFCDLKDFTAFAETGGDAAAIDAIDRFFEVVTDERGERGRFVKSLGDGAMLVYPEPADAVADGARIIAAMRGTGPPGVHASVHRGTAIARSGDYFGGAVNLTARLLALAERHELLATAAVVEACGDGFAWTAGGERALRGVATPVEVYKLLKTRSNY